MVNTGIYLPKIGKNSTAKFINGILGFEQGEK